jgi:signal transduction histidine kinase
VSHQAGERGVTLTIAEPDASIVIRADPERFRQIVLNLVGNAVKFTPPGGTVNVQQSLTDHDVIIQVRDTGRGIPRENHEMIFEPFVRLPRDRLTPGTGLGLAISREMARAMGGDLTLSGDIDVGSCFELRLPLSTRLAGEGASG